MSKGKFIALTALIAALAFTAAFFGVSTTVFMQRTSALQSSADAAQSQIDGLVSGYEQELRDKSDEIDRLESEVNRLESETERLESDLAKAKEMKAAAGQQKVCYLTFDDGPSDNTPEVLDILRENDVKATFFVTGTGRFDYIKRIQEDGHAIGLHTYSHSYADVYASDEAFFADLQKISDKVYEYTGIRSKLIRFPGGSSNLVSKKYCDGIMTRLTKAVGEQGYVYFDWNVDSTDGESGKSAADLVNAVKRNIPKSKSACVLMHDAGAKKETVRALPEIIQAFRDSGFTFDKLSEDSPTVHHLINN